MATHSCECSSSCDSLLLPGSNHHQGSGCAWVAVCRARLCKQAQCNRVGSTASLPHCLTALQSAVTSVSSWVQVCMSRSLHAMKCWVRLCHKCYSITLLYPGVLFVPTYTGKWLCAACCLSLVVQRHIPPHGPRNQPVPRPGWLTGVLHRSHHRGKPALQQTAPASHAGSRNRGMMPQCATPDLHPTGGSH